MTTSAEPVPLACPACGSGHLAGDERQSVCTTCRAEVRIARFRPVLDAAALDAGEGRCLNHPGKDAVDACGRCGGYVCDVCLTRTGEHLLCPACFDLMHGRGELATTRARRMRWDRLCMPLLLLSVVVCQPFAPVAIGAAIYVLVRRRRDRWLDAQPAVWTLVLAFLPLALLALVIAGAMAE